MQIKPFMPMSDAALMLFTSLTGEAELETEHLDINKINSSDGIKYLMDSLREPLQQKLLFQKRKLLADYEQIARYPNESVRQFSNRYVRVEKDLAAIGVSTSGMYDSESRGNRLLERTRLTPDLQRLVLIGAGNTLEFDRIRESLNFQFPDFRAAPQVMGHNSGGSSKGKGKGTSSTSSTTLSSSPSASSSSTSSGSASKFSKGNHPRRVYQADHEPELDQIPEESGEAEDDMAEEFEDAEEYHQDDDAAGDDGEPDDNQDDDVENLASVLTVTSKKLASTVLGRKFTGRPRSLEERKRTSTCAACGQTGHWAGDAICAASAKTNSKGAGKQSKDGGKGNASGKHQGQTHTKKAYVVNFPGELPLEVPHSPGEDAISGSSASLGTSSALGNPSSFYTFTTTHLVEHDPFNAYIAEIINFAGYMIVDTACQRSCCSRRWLDIHSKIMGNYRFRPLMVEASDNFQFGSGGLHVASKRAYLPAALPGQPTQGLLLGVSVLEDAQIPFLASNVMLEKLGCVIDTVRERLRFEFIGVDIPLHRKHGHYVVNIAKFTQHAHMSDVWKIMSTDEFLKSPDPEVMIAATLAQASEHPIRDPAHAARHQRPTRMASALAELHDPPDDVVFQDTAEHEQDGATSNGTTIMDDHAGTAQPDVGVSGRECFQTSSSPKSLHSSKLPKVWKQGRTFQPMQRLPAEVQVQSRTTRLGGLWRAALTALITIATALSFDHPAINESESHGVSTQGPSSQDSFEELYGTIRDYDTMGGSWDDLRGVRCRNDERTSSGFRRTRRLSTLRRGLRLDIDRLNEDYWELAAGCCIRHHLVPRNELFDPYDTDCPVALHRLRQVGAAEIEYQDGKLEVVRYNWTRRSNKQTSSPWTGRTVFQFKEFSKNDLTNACKRGLLQRLRHAAKLQEVEKVLMTKVKPRFRKSRVDLLETFAGAANISKQASAWGLKSLEPLDYNTGYDLAEPDTQRQVTSMIPNYRPLLLLQGVECGPWSILQDNTNFVHRPDELAEWRETIRPMIDQVVKWCEQQDDEGRFWLIENPETSRLWKEPAMRRLLARPSTRTTTCHAGAYGAVNSKGNMIKKPHTFWGNCPKILEQLGDKLNAEECKLCEPLQGRETTLSQHYCQGMVDAILLGLHQTAAEQDPMRPHSYATYAIDSNEVNQSLEAWQELFDKAEQLFRQTRMKNIVLAQSDNFWQDVRRLVPWHTLERVQIAKQPAIHRFPTHVPHTHRGSALLFNDGSRDVTVEDLTDIRYPKGRFQKPVNIGIFFFGMAHSPQQEPDQQQPQPASVQPHVEDNPIARADFLDRDITFPENKDYNNDTKNIVTRLHKNLGHPPAAELKKLLAMNGVSNQKILAAADDLICGSCKRTRAPMKPAPSSMPQSNFRQFADAIQLDIVYIRDITGQNFPVLGIIDECTHLHQACILESRLPEEVLRKFVQTWSQPFGFPLVCRLDADGSFRAAFEEHLDATGTFADFVPPEAHHRMGLIERHNATLRAIAERVIDAQGVVGFNQMEMAIAGATFSKNSCTWSSGRPPYIAAFGRIPRHGGLDLLSDQHRLAVGSTQGQMHQLADTLRAEAQQQIAAMTVDSSFRRALLRKAKPSPEDEYVIGDTLAYWRWTTRSGKKRGGYKLARMLGFDPDGKSLWVQSGTNTIKLAREQARKAYGFEAWHPDPSDLQALRMASENIKKGIFDDETIPIQNDPYQELGNDDHLKETFLEPAPLPALHPIQQLQPEPALQVVPHSSELSQPSSVLPELPQQPEAQQHTQINTQQEISNQHQQTNIHIEVTSPTYRQTINQQANTFGLTQEQLRRPAVRTPVRRTNRSRTPSKRKQPAIPETPDIPAAPATPLLDTPPQASHTQNTQPDTAVVISDDEVGDTAPVTPPGISKQAGTDTAPAPLTPAKRPLETHTGPSTPRSRTSQAAQPNTEVQAEATSKPDATTFHNQLVNMAAPEFKQAYTASMTAPNQHSPQHCKFHRTATQASMTYTTEGIELRDKHFDGTEEIYMPHKSNTCFKAYQTNAEYQGDGISDDSDVSQDDMSTSKAQPSLTRQQQKALDKELPWRTIMERGGDYLQAFIDATKAEETSWMQYDSVEPLSKAEADKIMASAEGRKRILKSRAAFRDKAKGAGPVRAKCRIVALGCLDPDLYSLNRDSATPTRQAEMIIYAIFISGYNKKMGQGEVTWTLWAGDVKTAFLQGEPEPRHAPLYLSPPRDGICIAAGVLPAPLYRIKGNIYGLASAPRTWTMHVCRRLKECGWQRHSLDKMLFFLYQRPAGFKEEILVAAAIVYVDDFLVTFNEYFNHQELLQIFNWGSQTTLTTENHLEFKGKEIYLRYDKRGFYVLEIKQQKFIEAFKSGKISDKKDDPLKPSDFPEYRSVAGSLQWVSGQTRPDVAATVSLHSKGSKAQYSDLLAMYDAVEHLRNTKTKGFIMNPVNINQSTIVVTYSDSSWANAENYASQHGCLVLLTDTRATEVATHGCLIDWKSSRSSRVCRSTLAAEASAADTSVDRSSFCNLMISEILQRMQSFRITLPLRMIQVTDCKSLYDSIIAENPSVEDKRTIISVRSIQQYITAENTHWVPTHLQWADGLTKYSKKLMTIFHDWLQHPYILLRDQSQK